MGSSCSCRKRKVGKESQKGRKEKQAGRKRTDVGKSKLERGRMVRELEEVEKRQKGQSEAGRRRWVRRENREEEELGTTRKI